MLSGIRCPFVAFHLLPENEIAMNITYKAEFFTYWHCGSGLSAGADVDLLTIKDADGLPFIPGKTIKGLLREASVTLSGLVSAKYPPLEEIDKIFGKEGTLQGSAFFSNAEFPDEDKAVLKDKSKLLFTAISSTAIGDDGIAKEHSLRRMEVALPCTLSGTIMHWPDDEKNLKLLTDSLAFVKRLGENRNRGLGRCKFSIMKKEADNE